MAECSGYRELAVAPWFPFGHSVSSMFATRVVCWKPDRCFGALSFKGGLPMPANDPAASLAGAPMLVIKGQFEEFGPGPSGVLRDFEDRETAWKGMHWIILGLREKDERHLIAYLVEPGLHILPGPSDWRRMPPSSSAKPPGTVSQTGRSTRSSRCSATRSTRPRAR